MKKDENKIEMSIPIAEMGWSLTGRTGGAL